MEVIVKKVVITPVELSNEYEIKVIARA